jgi:hypothetical protein
MPQVRVTRTILAQPTRLDELLTLSYKSAQLVADQTGIEPEVFWVRHAPRESGDVKIFMDFDSLAQYEELFLTGLLSSEAYLTAAEEAAELIRREPRDELLVLLDRDDFFLNMKDRTKAEKRNPAREARRATRYRTMRHVDVATGRLRDYMKHAFQFVEEFEQTTGIRADVFCTRFAAERIGCSQIFYDADDCPMCGPMLLKHTRELAVELPGVLERPPVDELYERVTEPLLDQAFGTLR